MKPIKILLILLLTSNMAYSQFSTKEIAKCAKQFSYSESCIYLRDFVTKFGGYQSQTRSWEVKLNAGTIYAFNLCGGRRFSKRAPDAVLKLFAPEDTTFASPLYQAQLGGSFTFNCSKGGTYYVAIGVKQPAKYGGAVGVIYFKGHSETEKRNKE